MNNIFVTFPVVPSASVTVDNPAPVNIRFPNVGVRGAQGPPGEVADVEWTQIDMTNKIMNLFSQQYLDLGSDGHATIRYERVGRTVRLKGNISFDIDHGSGAPVIMDFDLPYKPLTPPAESFPAFVSEFAYIIVYETTPGANDGRLLPLGPAISNLGGPSGLLFVQLTGNLQDANAGNVFSTSYPLDLSGRNFSIIFAANYEAADHA